MKQKRAYLLWLGLLTAVLLSCTTQAPAEPIVVSGAWVRPAQTMSVAYLQISNHGRSPQQLVGVETAVAASAELHETRLEDDIMRMRPVDAVTIDPGATVALTEGGLHVMLMDLAVPLRAGQTVPLTLHFASGETVAVTAQVQQEEVDALTVAAATAVAQGTYVGQLVDPPVKVQDFEVPSSKGGNGRLSDLDGQWRVIFFGYMHCPDFCPLTLVDYTQAKDALGDAAAEVAFIFISVDAARDTPEQLQTYLDHFDSDFVGFAADDATLARIQPDYGFYYERRLASGADAIYTIDHSTRSYLLDRDGVLRASFAYDTDPEVMAAALQWYLAQEQTN